MAEGRYAVSGTLLACKEERQHVQVRASSRRNLAYCAARKRSSVVVAIRS